MPSLRCFPRQLLARLVLGPLLLLRRRLWSPESGVEHGLYDHHKPQGRNPRWQADPQGSVEGVLSGAAEQEGRRDCRVRNGKLRAPFCNPDRLAPVAFAVAMVIEAMIPIGPKGLSSPRAVSRPPPNSQSPDRNAQGRPGRNPSISIKPLVPSRPCPPNVPNSF